MSPELLPATPFTAEGVPARPLPSGSIPHRIVVVRFQAFGDAIATLPVVAALAEKYPAAFLV